MYTLHLLFHKWAPFVTPAGLDLNGKNTTASGTNRAEGKDGTRSVRTGGPGICLECANHCQAIVENKVRSAAMRSRVPVWYIRVRTRHDGLWVNRHVEVGNVSARASRESPQEWRMHITAESDRSSGVQDMVCRSICVRMLQLALGRTRVSVLNRC